MNEAYFTAKPSTWGGKVLGTYVLRGPGMVDSAGGFREVSVSTERGLEEHQIERVLRALAAAYEAGKQAKSAEIREVLGVHEHGR